MHGLNGQSVSSSPFECAMHLRTPALFSSPYSRCNKSGEILTSYLGRRNIFQKTRRKTGPVGKGQPPRYAHLRGPTLRLFLLSNVVGVVVAVQVDLAGLVVVVCGVTSGGGGEASPDFSRGCIWLMQKMHIILCTVHSTESGKTKRGKP